MFTRSLKRMVHVPVFAGNEEKSQQAQILQIYLICHTAILLTALPVAIFASSSPVPATGIVLSLLVVNYGLSVISRRGYVNAATIAYILVNWVNSAIFVLASGGQSAAALFFPVIAMAALFRGLRTGLAVIGITLVYLYVIIVLQPVILSTWIIFDLSLFIQWVIMLLGSIVLLIPVSLKYRQVQQALQLAKKQLAERDEMEVTLRESEERFRIISSVTSDYTFSSHLDADGDLEHILLTGAFEEITGYTPDEFLAIGGWQTTIHPDDRERDTRNLEMLKQNQPIESELRILHKSGDVRRVKVLAKPVMDETGQRLVAINGGVRDITAAKRAAFIQQALYNISKARTETDNLQELIRFTHEQLKTLLAVENFFIALYDDETGLYHFPYVVDQREQNDWSPDPLENSLTDYVRRTGESVLITAEEHEEKTVSMGLDLVGTWSAVWVGVPLKTTGDVFGVIAIQDYQSPDTYTQDDVDLMTYVAENIAWVIQSKRQEEELQAYTENLERLVNERTNALRLANEQFELILNNTDDALAFARPNGDIVISNPAFAAIFGDDNKASLEYILKTLADEDQTKTFSTALLNTIQESRNQRVEAQVATPQEEIRDIDFALLPVMANGSLTSKQGILLSGRDITHVREVDRFKTQFVADAVHDLATPISGLSTRIYLLKRSPDKVDQHVESLENQVQHLMHLLEDLKTLSRLDRNRLSLDKSSVNLNQLVRHVFDTYEPVAIEKQQTLTLTLDSNLPQAELDQRQLERVLVNLVSNAINYTASGKKIIVKTELESDCITFTVTDQGMGIAPEDQERIFERFYRTDKARSDLASGTGLGLAITKNIVELHGGTIQVTSEVDKGSTFTVSLPV